jgi:hypothetical protein
MRYEELINAAKMKITTDISTYFKCFGNIPKIDEDGAVSFDGSIEVKKTLPKGRLPINLKSVGGTFSCTKKGLKTLQGCPTEVGEGFLVAGNDLTSLAGCPQVVPGHFICSENGPDVVKGEFWCSGNPLTSLKGLSATRENITTLTWSKNLPVLRLVGSVKVFLFDEPTDRISDIINKFSGTDNLRAKIVTCQKELIDAGFEGNASW